MHKVRTFESPEEMIAYMDKMREDAREAFKRVPEWVKEALVPGAHYMRIYDEGLIIFGEVIESDYEEDRELMARSPELRLVRAFSVACPDGELGSEHVCTMLPVPPEVFEFAKSENWNVRQLDLLPFTTSEN